MDINGLSSNYQNYLDIYKQNNSSSSGSLSKLDNIDLSGASDEELKKVCQDFEAYFLEQVMKKMMETTKLDDEQEDSTSSLVDYFKDQTIASLAKESTEQKGLGLAQTLYEQMKRNMEDALPVEMGLTSGSVKKNQ